MTRMIDAEALRENVNSHGPYERADQPDWDTVKSVLAAIDAAPTICCETCGKGEGNGGDCSGTFWRSVKRPEQSGGTGCSAWEVTT